MIKIRENKVDNIRAIAMICIVLAHCGAPLIINNFRVFDVITLVFLSSYIIDINILYEFNSYKKNVCKRIIRLFKPTIIFIIVMGIIQFFVYKFAGRNELLTFDKILNSFLLCENSIGYVWIIKVYLVNFIMSPFLIKIIKVIKYTWLYTIVLLILYFIYILFIIFCQNKNEYSYLSWVIINEWGLCCMFYLIVALDAIYFKVDLFWKKYGIIFWLIIFTGSCLFYKSSFYFAPALDKRPAGIQYLAYGMLITHLLFKIVKNRENKFFRWISSNSMEIYYVHTFFIFVMSCIQVFFKINNKFFWIIQFFITFIGTVATLKKVEILKKVKI